MAITHVSLDLLKQNQDFQTLLELANKMISNFLSLGPFFTKKRALKKLTEFF